MVVLCELKIPSLVMTIKDSYSQVGYGCLSELKLLAVEEVGRQSGQHPVPFLHHIHLFKDNGLIGFLLQNIFYL